MNQNRFFQLTAFFLFTIIIGAAAMMWPLPTLGFDVELNTGMVLAVQPGTTAFDAGLRPGDRITHIYGYPWEQVNTQLLLVPLPWREGTPTPVVIVRENRILDLVLFAGPPSRALQTEKVIRGIIALICWVTGFLLGTSPRATDPRLRRTGWFWVLLGGSLGLYAFTLNVSYILTVGVLWFQCAVLALIAIAMQCWYPPRPGSSMLQQRVVQRYLVIALAVVHVVGIPLLLLMPTTTSRFYVLHEVVRAVFLLTFGLSGIVLWRRICATTTVAHIRRQIRLIGAACGLACAWAILLLLLRLAAPTLGDRVPPAAFPLGATLIPLAYLVGGVRADLMRLDQMARRALLHMLALLFVFVVLVIGQQAGLFVITPAFGIVVLILFHIPLYRFLHHRLLPYTGEADRDRALRATARALATSLEAPLLTKAVGDGMRAAFLRPPLALYHAADPDQPLLTRVCDQHLGVPPTVDAGLLDRWKDHGTTLLKATQIQHGLEREARDPNLAGLIFHPTILLWGSIRDQQQRLLSLVLLGPRGDDDPYQPQDLRALEQLLDTAALAFTNSASYAAQVAARAELRDLYMHAQQIEEQTAAEIANGIHDQVLSTQLRLNMEQLTLAMHAVNEPKLREQLADILAGEETIDETLRLVCEQLKPTEHADPLGLPASLRQEAKWIRANWRKPVDVQMMHDPVPLTPNVQRALVKITHEALINAVTHAKPTALVVGLQFPNHSCDPLVLMITNDGLPPAQPIAAKRRHWGVRNMREYADAIGASIQWVHPEAGGTSVIVTLSAAVIGPVIREAQEIMEQSFTDSPVTSALTEGSFQ